MAKKTYKELLQQIKDFAKKKPLQFSCVGLAAVMVMLWLLSAMELLPEFERFGRLPAIATASATKNVAIEQGDSYVWLGMQVVPVSRTIRQEFKIPRRIKGMFVLDEGRQLARKYAVKTGDVIVSISRKPVPDARRFVETANSVQYYDGILLDVYRDGANMYITIPFEYQYGPLLGPYKGSWQFGSPLAGKAFPYGRILNYNTNAQNR